MADPFDSAWLKWGWAVVRAQALEKDIGISVRHFQARKPFVAKTKYEPQRHCISLYLESVEQPPGRLGLHLGDVANNFRAALDQLAWALVTTRGKRPMVDREPERIYFPLAATRQAFNDHPVVSQFLRSADRAIIRRYQPYVRGKRNVWRHCLTLLAALNREDKHRTINPIWMVPQGGKLEYGEPVHCTITRAPTTARGIVLQPGAEIQADLRPKDGTESRALHAGNTRRKPNAGRAYPRWKLAGTTTSHVRNLLLEFAPPPEEITTLGIVPNPDALSPEGITAP